MITIKNLKKSFGKSLIFQNVNLEIEKGDAVVIIGGSGCGKSTLLRCMNRLEQADEGQILINGRDILSPDADVEKIRRTMGMVYQSFNLFSHLNVMENMILAPMKVLNMPQDQAIGEAKKMLEMVGMENRGDRMPSQLSGGQKQRVAIARAMMMKPEVMLFDEPTSALDPTMVDEVESVIRNLIQSGMTCIIVTHEMRFAKNIASKVVFLAEQGIYEQGSAEDIFDHPSKELTRQFLYRSRLFEKTVTRQNVDIYSLCSEIKAFASPYGFMPRQMRGIEMLCDELLLPLIRSTQDPSHQVTIRFVAEGDGKDHMVLVEFPFLTEDPLKSSCLDELNLALLKAFTKEIESVKRAEGGYEVQAKL